MPLIEILTISVGTAVAKTALKFWLRDSELAQDISLGLVDILHKKIPGLISRRRTERQLERIAEEVAESLAPFFERESSGLPKNEQQAAALAVADTFNKSTITDKLLLSKDLEPIRIEQHLRKVSPDATRDLSGAAVVLYDAILRESCNYLIEIISAIPDFTLITTREILKREGEIVLLINKVLSELPKSPLYAQHGARSEIDFETQYRREVARKLDRLTLFGLSVLEAIPRYNLSVAYITLMVERSRNERDEKADRKADTTSRPLIEHDGYQKDGSERLSVRTERENDDTLNVQIDKALADSQRIFIRGEAGSGKTTLLQWLAVRSARRDFEGALAKWNDTIPFFIPLRRFVDGGLPSPENLPNHIAESITGEMPNGWVHRQLRSGRSLLLIDGVDELPQAKRKRAREWLIDLTANFPESQYILTSRPPAVGESWLENEGFKDCELQPMTLPDIDIFIDHWYAAAEKELNDSEEINELIGFGAKLKGIIRENRQIRNLATSPLLCAMLCALNRARKTQLPNDRMELYRIALEMLLDRRDVEREIPTEGLPRLKRREKELLLQDLAYWLLINNYLDVDRAKAQKRLEGKLAFMPHPEQDASKILQYLLERSGVLREPVADRVDFIHRTFQEFLGAKAAIEENDIGVLVEKASNDQWREVITLAAGHALKEQREELLGKLLERGNKEPRHRHALHLLAVACLETSPELSPRLRFKLNKCVRSLIPPKNMSDARALASAGELAVPLLGGYHRKNVKVATACIRTLELVGGEKALDQLRAYGKDNRITVVRELMRAWHYFDPVVFARDVLLDSPLKGGYLEITDKTFLPGIPYLKNLDVLKCRFVRQLEDLSALDGLGALSDLEVIGSPNISDLSPLIGISELQQLSFEECIGISDLGPITHLRNLVALALVNCPGVTDLAPLAQLQNLKELDLGQCEGISDLTPLAGLTELTSIYFSGCEGVGDLTPLAEVTELKNLVGSYSAVTDLDPISDLTALRWISFDGCSGISDLNPLKNLRELYRVDFDSCTKISDLSALAELRNMKTVYFQFCPHIKDLGPLRGLVNLEEVHLAGCDSVTDLSPLAKLQYLQFINLRKCAGVRDLEPLLKLPRLRRVIVTDGEILVGLPDEFIEKVIRIDTFRSYM